MEGMNFLNKVYYNDTDKAAFSKYGITDCDEQLATHNILSKSGERVKVNEGMKGLFNMIAENYTFVRTNDSNVYYLHSFNEKASLYIPFCHVELDHESNQKVINPLDMSQIKSFNEMAKTETMKNIHAMIDEAKAANKHIDIRIHPMLSSILEELLPALCDETNADSVECTPTKLETPIANIEVETCDDFNGIPDEIRKRALDKINKFKAINKDNKAAGEVVKSFYAFTNSLKGIKESDIPEIFALESDQLISLIMTMKQMFG